MITENEAKLQAEIDRLRTLLNGKLFELEAAKRGRDEAFLQIEKLSVLTERLKLLLNSSNSQVHDLIAAREHWRDRADSLQEAFHRNRWPAQ